MKSKKTEQAQQNGNIEWYRKQTSGSQRGRGPGEGRIKFLKRGRLKDTNFQLKNKSVMGIIFKVGTI